MDKLAITLLFFGLLLAMVDTGNLVVFIGIKCLSFFFLIWCLGLVAYGVFDNVDRRYSNRIITGKNSERIR